MISRWDRAVVEGFQHLHWGPADWFAELLSDWWVKSLVIIGIGLVADIWWRRFPLGVGLATISYLAAEGLSLEMKSWFDRERPSVADPAVHPLVAVPHNGSMPSTHAASAFAAALAVSFVHPKLRWWVLGLAALISLSRVWLGVHYLSDVIVGAAVGCGVAWAVWSLSRAAGREFRARSRIGA